MCSTSRPSGTRGWALLLPLVLLGACDPARFTVQLEVVDEQGQPLADAEVEVAGEQRLTDRSGRVTLPRLDHPELALVHHPEHLSEPVPLGRGSEDEPVQVTLLRSEGRVVIHSTGDVMMGRRYQQPTDGEPLLLDDDGSSARALVADISPALALADLVTVNLETVVGELGDEQAYPGKRWLLQTPPSALEALEPLGVNVAVLANNHQRDWLEEGVASTLQELERRDVPQVGGGLTSSEAAEALILDVDGLRVGILAYTSVDGDYVNDQYPLDGETAPDPLEEADRFKWETRLWGAPNLGVPEQQRRIGSAWSALRELEGELSEGQLADLWASAEQVYPELQDWVARRGHGGANPWVASAAQADIAALEDQVDLTIVQLHMGFQFATSPSGTTESAARLAVDAGADLVVGHHPHVLQGLEWYQGRLLAYSLGNFVFDQDFLSTFRSVFLRTVWEGDTLVQARLVPMMLDRYRPVPTVDRLAQGTLRSLWERSLLGATASRGADLQVRAVHNGEGDRQAPGFIAEWGTAQLSPSLPAPVTLQVTGAADELVPAPGDGLVWRRLNDSGDPALWVGRELNLFGDFEDEDTDAQQADGAGWTWSSRDVKLDRDDPITGLASLSLYRDVLNPDPVSARMIARVTLPEHRVFADRQGEQALDGDARWSVRLTARRGGTASTAAVRLALYHFNDLDPTQAPVSVSGGEVTLPFEVDTRAETLVLELPDDLLSPRDGLVPNAALLYIDQLPPEFGASTLWVDDISLIEWRPAAQEPEGWAAIDWIRSDGEPIDLQLRALPLTP